MRPQQEQHNLIDYRFYCFNGEPCFVYSYTNGNDFGEGKPEPKYCDILDCDWKPLPFHQKSMPSGMAIKPNNLEQMITLAKTLCENLPFLRVDFYEIDKKIYFGELTLFPGSGFSAFYPDEWDKKLGDMLTLP